jgi:predicted transcriptional regulator
MSDELLKHAAIAPFLKYARDNAELTLSEALYHYCFNECGMSVNEIAKEVDRSPHTVKTTLAKVAIKKRG